MKKIVCLLLVSILLECLCFSLFAYSGEEKKQEQVDNANRMGVQIQQATYPQEEITSGISLYAKNAILYDRKCKRILYAKKPYEQVPNASTTKILTAITVVENCDVNEIAEVGQNAINVAGSKVKFRKGDKVSVNDLMNGMLLCSRK